MGKKTDRGYMLNKEWVADFGGKGKKEEQTKYEALPYTACALSMQPWNTPVILGNDGVVYDKDALVQFLNQFQIHPLTGEKCDSTEMTELFFTKNPEGKYCDPLTSKEFTNFSHIVAIKVSGFVYAFDTIQELVIKVKNWKDPNTGKPFTRKDIITLQDPNNKEISNGRNIATFFYLKQGLKARAEGPQPEAISIPSSIKAKLKEYNENQEKQKKMSDFDSKEVDPSWEAIPTQAPSFTSTGWVSDKVFVDARSVVHKTDQKGYVTLSTRLGDLRFELHCDLVPKTCENFLRLCENGFFVHNLLFGVQSGECFQSGDPNGTGNGGRSVWGRPFPDEFSSKLQHAKRGTLSMVSKEKDQNNSVFRVSFAPQASLNFKQSVFGLLVGGFGVLDAIEQLPVDAMKRPLEPVEIIQTTVHLNPFRPKKEEKESIQQPLTKLKNDLTSFEIGKYLPQKKSKMEQQ